MRHHLRLLALLVAAAMSLAGLAVTSAQAAVATTLSGTVIDANTEAPLRGISVFAVNVDELDDTGDGAYDENEGFAFLFATNSDGEFSGRANGRLAPGTWVLGFQDTNGSYVATSEVVTLTEGANALPSPIQMSKGGTVSGVVTAPSGAQLKGVDVFAYDPDEVEPEEGDYAGLFADLPFSDTDRDGSYELRGIPAGSYELQAAFEDGYQPEPVPFTISGPEDATEADVTDVQVPVETHISGRTSSSKGRAGVSFRVDAAQFGIDEAGGTIRLKDGSKTLKSAAALSGNRISINLGGLKKGTHTFHVKYLGGVDTQVARTVSVSVKVK